MAGPACALALVLLMDVSSSVSNAHYQQERDGTAPALLSQEVRDAMADTGDVAIEVVEWASGQNVTVPWTIVHDGHVDDLAQAVAATHRSGAGDTYMGGALDMALNRFAEAPCTPTRMVVDISGDGRSNALADSSLTTEEGPVPMLTPMPVDDGTGTGTGESDGSIRDRMPGGVYHMDHAPFKAAHARAVSMRVQVNGLPIVASEHDVDVWYRRYVPANNGFVIVSQGFDSYERALLQKLTIEIGSLQLGHPTRLASR
jgi:hypothetical protein